jgi:aryl-alcohol dehydrogenase-like predicted oxidoreductase
MHACNYLSVPACTAQEELVPTARELGIGFLAYSPLGRGILTGQLKELANLPDTDWRKAHNPRFQGEAFKKASSTSFPPKESPPSKGKGMCMA